MFEILINIATIKKVKRQNCLISKATYAEYTVSLINNFVSFILNEASV